MDFPITINTREELQEIGRVIAADLRAMFNLPKPSTVAQLEDEFMTVLTTQGAEAAHKWQKDQMKRRRKSA